MPAAVTIALDTASGAAVAFDWFCWAVPSRVVYPPTGPLKVGEAVTKTIVMLLGLDALALAAEVDNGVSTEAMVKDDAELDCALLGTAAIDNPSSELDCEALAVSSGGNGAVTSIVVSTVTMLVAWEYTVATLG